MAEIFNNKINLLKALAILVVVSGHLEFALIPMFPPYSFQVVLFFFISGLVFKEKYGFWELTRRRAKSLLLPYFAYAAFYLVITALIAPVTGKFWGMDATLKNELLMPFLTGHQIDLISPLWFVPCLFLTLLAYRVTFYIKCPEPLKTLLLAVLAFVCAEFGAPDRNIYLLPLIRTGFALFFVHLGFLFKNLMDDTPKAAVFKGFNPFSFGVLSFVLVLQSILWFFNKDYSPQDGIGLHYLLVWGEFANPLLAIMTSITGIYISLFIVNLLYDKVKGWGFLQKIGQNTYHIMANHLFVFNIITYILLFVTGQSFDIKNSADIYWFFFPLKTTYFYFLAGVVLPVYFGEFLKYLRKKLFSHIQIR